jgi:hypothetical protein
MTAVSVNAPFQVVHEGVVYAPGDTADVPDDLATTWLAAGWVTKAKAAPEKRVASKPAPNKRAG